MRLWSCEWTGDLKKILKSTRDVEDRIAQAVSFVSLQKPNFINTF